MGWSSSSAAVCCFVPGEMPVYVVSEDPGVLAGEAEINIALGFGGSNPLVRFVLRRFSHRF